MYRVYRHRIFVCVLSNENILPNLPRLQLPFLQVIARVRCVGEISLIRLQNSTVKSDQNGHTHPLLYCYAST